MMTFLLSTINWLQQEQPKSREAISRPLATRQPTMHLQYPAGVDKMAAVPVGAISGVSLTFKFAMGTFVCMSIELGDIDN